MQPPQISTKNLDENTFLFYLDLNKDHFCILTGVKYAPSLHI